MGRLGQTKSAGRAFGGVQQALANQRLERLGQEERGHVLLLGDGASHASIAVGEFG
jgi:hypothetical protein